MGQNRMRKADNPALRAEITELRRAGLPIDRQALADKHGVTTSAVQVARSEIDSLLEAEPRSTRRPGGRTVADFNGRYLRAYREASRLFQEELGDMAKVSRGEIGHLELGHRKPTLGTLRNLEDALDVPAGWLQEQPGETAAEREARHDANYEKYREQRAVQREAAREAAVG